MDNRHDMESREHNIKQRQDPRRKHWQHNTHNQDTRFCKSTIVNTKVTIKLLNNNQWNIGSAVT